MIKYIYRLFFFACFLIGLHLCAMAQGPNCMTVTMASSAISNTTVPATVSIASCASPGVQFQGISLNVQSSNPAAASALTGPVQFSSTGFASIQIATKPVTTPTPVTLTFSTQLSGGTITTTKTLTVCQFQFDIAVSNVAVTQQQPAGQTSQVRVTIQNNGAQTLSANGFSVKLKTDPDTSASNLALGSCSSSPPTAGGGTVFSGDIAPGQTGTA